MCAAADPDDTVAESNEGNNVACMPVVVLSPPDLRPDYIPVGPLPSPAARVGLSVSLTFSVAVQNAGNATPSQDAVLAFYNETTRSTPFQTFAIPPVTPPAMSGRFDATWISPSLPGIHRVFAEVDFGDALVEWDESNNVHAWTVQVVAGPVTNLVVGAPNVTIGQTYVTSATVLSFSVLDQSGTGIRNTMYRIGGGPWVNYTATGPFSLTGEGPRFIEWFSEDFAGNVEATASAGLVVDSTPPTTTSVIGDPKYLNGGTFVTSWTPISLSSVDGAPWPVGVGFVEHRIDGGPWSLYATPIVLGGEGTHTVDVRATDLLGNLEPMSTTAMIVDDTPPFPTLSVGTPQYAGARLFVKSSTPLMVLASDAGAVPVGLAVVQYRIDGGPWTPFASPFVLPPVDGTHRVGYAAGDRLGNAAGSIADLVVDDAPPETTIAPLAGPYAEDTLFTLVASDAGSGVAFTEYRIDDHGWTNYVGGFSLLAGDHVIRFRSVDRLGNSEVERTMSVSVVGASPTLVTNWKPLVAAAFAAVLTILGIWSSRRAPTFGGRTNVGRTFLLAALPFVVAEAATGVVSAMTGQLAIPPILGIGTITDAGILVAGAVVSFVRVRAGSRPALEPPSE